MRCSEEIANILIEILTRGILHARATDEPQHVLIELDHIHNLPALLGNYSVELLDYYWNVERPCYESAIERLGGRLSDDSYLRELWERLRPFVDSARISGAAA